MRKITILLIIISLFLFACNMETGSPVRSVSLSDTPPETDEEVGSGDVVTSDPVDLAAFDADPDEPGNGSGSDGEDPDAGDKGSPGYESLDPGTYYTLEELFGTSAAFTAVALGDVNLDSQPDDEVNLLTDDLLIDVNNLLSGVYKIELDFRIDGQITKSRTFHISILDGNGDSIGFINLQVKKSGVLSAVGHIRLSRPDQTLQITWDTSGNSEGKQDDLNALLSGLTVIGVRIYAKPAQLDID